VFTLVAHADSVDPAAAWLNIVGVPDQHVTVAGNDILVPKLNYIMALAAAVDQTVASQARLRSPSLLGDGFEEWLSDLASGLVFATGPQIKMLDENPIELSPLEALQAQVFSNPGAAAVHYVLTWLCDGSIQPAKGRIRTVRCTAAATLVTEQWVNAALVFPSSLKAGRYAVVGMSAKSANLVAARVVIPGSPWRPGVVAGNNEFDVGNNKFRGGRLGIWGEFEHSSPPTVDFLGVTDAAEEVFLDLMYMG
jgi:hypothetical protein